MILPSFTLHRPRSLEEAMAAVTETGGDFDWIGGGTDLLPNYKNRLNPKPHVVSVGRIEGLDALASRRLGAAATLHRLTLDQGLRRDFPALAETAAQVASPLLIRSATLGGKDLLALKPHERARAGLARTFQSLELFDDLTVEDNLHVAAEEPRWYSFLQDFVVPKRPTGVESHRDTSSRQRRSSSAMHP